MSSFKLNKFSYESTWDTAVFITRLTCGEFLSILAQCTLVLKVVKALIFCVGEFLILSLIDSSHQFCIEIQVNRKKKLVCVGLHFYCYWEGWSVSLILPKNKVFNTLFFSINIPAHWPGTRWECWYKNWTYYHPSLQMCNIFNNMCQFGL